MNQKSNDNLIRELVVMTRPAKFGERTPGHAMIAISTEGKKVEAWGFYLKKNKNGDHVIDEVKEGGWARYTRTSVVSITLQQHKNIKKEIANWRKKKYKWWNQNCTDFVHALLIKSGIPAPKNGWLPQMPDYFGEALTDLHGTGGGRCIGPQNKEPTAPNFP